MKSMFLNIPYLIIFFTLGKMNKVFNVVSPKAFTASILCRKISTILPSLFIKQFDLQLQIPLAFCIYTCIYIYNAYYIYVNVAYTYVLILMFKFLSYYQYSRLI